MIADKAEDPMLLNYMKLVRGMMRLVGAWPGDAVAGRPRRRLPYYALALAFTAYSFALGHIYFLYYRYHDLDFSLLGDVYLTLILSSMTGFRCSLPLVKGYGKIYWRFLREFHLSHFKHKGEYVEQICRKIDRASYYFAVYICILAVTGSSTFNFSGLVLNYLRGAFHTPRPENITLEFSVHYMYPGFTQEEHFLSTTCINIFVSYVCGFSFNTHDLFLCLVVFQLIGHIKTLVNTLRSFPKLQGCTSPELQQRRGSKQIVVGIVKVFNDEENETIKQLIKECVDHHVLIVSFADKISTFFGPLLAFNYLYQVICLCIMLVQCMSGKSAFLRYFPLTFGTLGQLLQFSIIFEIVGTESEKLKDEVYFVPWESMSVSNQKAVCFLLSRVQTPIHVTAMGMTPVGVQTMSKILKTTLSYCAFLRTMNP